MTQFLPLREGTSLRKLKYSHIWSLTFSFDGYLGFVDTHCGMIAPMKWSVPFRSTSHPRSVFTAPTDVTGCTQPLSGNYCIAIAKWGLPALQRTGSGHRKDTAQNQGIKGEVVCLLPRQTWKAAGSRREARVQYFPRMKMSPSHVQGTANALLKQPRQISSSRATGNCSRGMGCVADGLG